LKEHGDSKTLRVVNSLYVRAGISRISTQQELLEVLSEGLLKNISASLSPPSPTGALLLHFLFQILPRIDFPRRGDPSNEGYREILGLSQEDASSLTTWFGKLLLLPYDQSTEGLGSPYLSKADSEFLSVAEINQAWNSGNTLGLSLAKTKAVVLDFIDTGAFIEDERLLVYLFAGPETNPSGISDRGARFVKVAKLAKDDEEIVNSLYQAYNSDAASTPITLRTRILTLLSRSPKIAKFSKEAGKILQGQLESRESGLLGQRFNSAFVAYIVHTFRLMNKTFRKESAASLTSTLRDFIVNIQGWPKPDPASDIQIRAQAYRLLGVAAQEGELLDLELLDFLFSSLNEDNSGRETMLFVEEALSALTQALSKAPLSPDMMTALESWLVTAAQGLQQKPAGKAPKSIHKSYPFIISRIANRCLPYNSVSARYVDVSILAIRQQTFEAKEEASIGLDPYLFRTNNSHRPDLWYKSSKLEALKMLEPDSCDFLWPSFEHLARLLFRGIELDEFRVEEEEETFETIKSQWTQMPAAFLMSLRYLYRMFLMDTVASNPANSGRLSVSENWETQMDLSLEQPLWQKKG
jgi:proteasome component ECM29